MKFCLAAASAVAFAQPFGRFVCFPNELCVSFGGPTADALVFLGWHYQHDAAPIPPDLFTAAGLGIGVRWSDHLDDITMKMQQLTSLTNRYTDLPSSSRCPA